MCFHLPLPVYPLSLTLSNSESTCDTLYLDKPPMLETAPFSGAVALHVFLSCQPALQPLHGDQGLGIHYIPLVQACPELRQREFHLLNIFVLSSTSASRGNPVLLTYFCVVERNAFRAASW